jgi:hypothetical protein
MKRSLKKEIEILLSGVKNKGGITIADTYNCPEGFYRYDGMIVSSIEFEALTKGFDKVVIFSLAGHEVKSDKEEILNVTVDSPETAETLIKLRNEKKFT